jgi:hypothetical protein
MLVVDLVIHHVEANSAAEIQTEFGQAIFNLEFHKEAFVNEIWQVELEQIQGATGENLLSNQRVETILT